VSRDEAALYRADLANDLTTVVGVLRKEVREGSNLSPLDRAAAVCRAAKNANEWEYDFDGVSFTAEVKHVPGAMEISVELSLSVRGICHPEQNVDPLVDLSMQIVLVGSTGKETTMAAWHLDRHPEHQDSKQMHPRYHLQHAGHRIKKSGIDFGASLFLDVPRIVHAPLDGILAVDFVLGSYLPDTFVRCRDNAQYCRCVKSAQERLWKPYVAALHSFWSDGATSPLASGYWPSIYC